MNKDRVKHIEAIQNWGYDNGYIFIWSEADDLLNRILEPEAKPEPEMMIAVKKECHIGHGKPHIKNKHCELFECIPVPEEVKATAEEPVFQNEMLMSFDGNIYTARVDEPLCYDCAFTGDWRNCTKGGHTVMNCRADGRKDGKDIIWIKAIERPAIPAVELPEEINLDHIPSRMGLSKIINQIIRYLKAGKEKEQK